MLLKNNLQFGHLEVGTAAAALLQGDVTAEDGPGAAHRVIFITCGSIMIILKDSPT